MRKKFQTCKSYDLVLDSRKRQKEMLSYEREKEMISYEKEKE